MKMLCSGHLKMTKCSHYSSVNIEIWLNPNKIYSVGNIRVLDVLVFTKVVSIRNREIYDEYIANNRNFVVMNLVLSLCTYHH